MAASNTFSYHVFGPVIPQTNAVAGGSTFANLGVCEEGVDIDIIPRVSDVKHDGGGGANADEVENILLNCVCVVRFRLVPFAGIQVNALRRKAHAGSTDGTMPQPGTLFGFGGYYVGLYLPQTALGALEEVDGPWYFPYCRVVRPGNNRVSTKETKLDFEFRAINYFNIASFNTILNNVLYQRAAP